MKLQMINIRKISNRSKTNINVPGKTGEDLMTVRNESIKHENQTIKILVKAALLLGLSFSISSHATSGIESEASVVESEEALAKSDAARQESADAQREMEQEKLNSESVMSKAKAAIVQAEQDEKAAIKARLATEKFVAQMKKKKAELQAKKNLAELNAKKAKRALTAAEKQKESLVSVNSKLSDRNQELSAQIKEFNKQEKALAVEIRQLKIQHERQLKLKKSLQMKLGQSKAKLKSLQAMRSSLR